MANENKQIAKDVVMQLVGDLLDQKTDSISVSKTSAGKYSFDCKMYSKDLLTKEGQDALISAQIEVFKRLEREFVNAEKSKD